MDVALMGAERPTAAAVRVEALRFPLILPGWPTRGRENPATLGPSRQGDAVLGLLLHDGQVVTAHRYLLMGVRRLDGG